MLLVKEVSGLSGQVNHWKSLYDQIKDNLAEKIELSMVSKQDKIDNERMEEESYNVCKECELRKLSQEHSGQTVSNETQTDNLYDCYYKEMKDYLKYLKEIYKEYEIIPNTSKDMVKVAHEIRERFIAEIKEKHDKMQLTFKAKGEELKRDKAENEEWRKKAR